MYKDEQTFCLGLFISLLHKIGSCSVKFPYSPILNYACKVINYACISFVYKDNRNSREDRIYTYLIILTYSPLWLL